MQYGTLTDGAHVSAPEPLHIGRRVTAEQVRAFAPKWITAEQAEKIVGGATGEGTV